MISIDDIERIYKSLNDDESKKIFETRFSYWSKQTDEFAFAEILYGRKCRIADFDDWYKKHSERIVVFGAGRVGAYTTKVLIDSGYHVDSIVDTYKYRKRHTNIWGVNIISFDELCRRKNDYVVIVGSVTYRQQIYEQLLINGFSRECIYYPHRGYIRGYISQYFDFFSASDDEVFVDCGAYDGQTSVDFVKWTNGKYKKIYLFEANPNNVNMIEAKLEHAGIDRYSLISKGVFSREGSCKFNDNAGKGANISDEGDSEIIVTSLDHEIGENKVTIIKMDIEGAEMAALEGAKRIIREQKPRLMICIYHKKEDFVLVPLKILEICSEYKFAIRHYCTGDEETVLYAWI